MSGDSGELQLQRIREEARFTHDLELLGFQAEVQELRRHRDFLRAELTTAVDLCKILAESLMNQPCTCWTDLNYSCHKVTCDRCKALDAYYQARRHHG